ncbi:zinc metalloprotease [Marivivens niveibacter]|uniref:Zinc metalloprotease n=1 Tax=Marivivens niveibacter TaxID=1930667 RepID=A0A251WWZ0_9RHOB|nr:SprT family zinc-dependent metalloprotease [Marivivens niveibacter]OUD08947.1 zinc metalloprotease [Marivivens niveibacter]
MGRLVLGGNPPIEVSLRRSPRARRLSLRISRLDGRVTMTLPNPVPEREAMAFLRDRENWVRDHLSGLEGERFVAIGQVIPFGGTEYAITAHDKRRVEVADDRLMVPNDPDRVAARVQGFLKTHARDALATASDKYAAMLGRGYGRITLRDTRSRWGSCTSRGDLMYSWRLIMAPPHILDYVAAHEVAHLIEMNHSAAFWDVVHSLYPDFETARRWLRDHGGALHRIRFD